MANKKFDSHNSTPKNRRARTLKKKKKITSRPVLMVFLGVIIFSILALGGYTMAAIIQAPKWDPDLLSDQKESSIVYDNKGEVIAQLHASENRLLVEYEDIPQLVKDTFIAVEDKRFFEHYGFDVIRIIKSALDIVKAGEVVGGGSTITIQLAKNAFIEDPTALKLSRKIQELVLALQIERTYTKEEILTFYLNRIYLGESCFGIRTAAQTYFGKELDELNPAEVALLAGLPQAPSAYDPYVNPDLAKKRRNIVLSIMKENGIISEAEYEEYKDEPFEFVEQVKAKQAKVKLPGSENRNKKHPYFVDYVIHELQEKHGFTPEEIFSGGLRIYTTVDSRVQSVAEEAFADPANFPKSIDDQLVQGAITVLEPETGAITVMVGGREYTPMGLNRVWQSKRQPGSTAKPLVVYAPALENGGYFPGTVFDDMPVKYSDGTGGVWAPTNYDTLTSGWRGLITMREAVKDSVNVYAVKLLESLGVNKGWEFAKNNLGLKMTEADRVLPLALGTFQISPLEMATAYSSFANGGYKVEPHSVTKVEGPNGKVIFEHKPTRKRIMKETTAYLMNDLLRTVVTSGTGTRARIGNWYICGKTGTTSLDPKKYGQRTGNPDAWFAGYSPKYVGVVWMGYDKDEDLRHYLYKVYGSSYPTTIWKKVMTAAHEGLPVQSSIKMPPGIVRVTIDKKSGLLPSSLTPDKFIITEIAAADSVPVKVSDIWIEVEVDADNPDCLPAEGSTNTITKICLNLPNRPKGIPWPKDEAPYKIPEKVAKGSPGVAPPAGDPNIPRLSISEPFYDPGSTRVQIPVHTSFDSSKYMLMLYIKRPNQPYLETFVPEDGKTKSANYRLSFSSKGAAPGTYTFWVALINNQTFAIGPPSRPVSITISR
ncbi:MAG: transglycosylase domain-containing protein [Desulfitobacteriia bacterium]|jgi:penicillin-binding protein 1A